jgi:hypothetical protein
MLPVTKREIVETLAIAKNAVFTIFSEIDNNICSITDKITAILRWHCATFVRIRVFFISLHSPAVYS